MGRRRFFIMMIILLATAAAPCWDGQGRAQSGGTVESDRAAAVERLRERAERVQERRKLRITQEQREAAADRARAAGEKEASRKGSPKAAPVQGGRGGGR